MSYLRSIMTKPIPTMTSGINYCLSTLVVFTVRFALCYGFHARFVPSWSTAERTRLLLEAAHLAPTNVEMQQKHAELLSRAADLQSVMKEYATLRAHLSKASHTGLGPNLPRWNFGAVVGQTMKPELYYKSYTDPEVQEVVEPAVGATWLTLLNWATMWIFKRGGHTTLVVALLWRTLFMAPFILALALAMRSANEAEQACPTFAPDKGDESWQVVQKDG
ncbi:hypothetical protein LTR56_013557 [Elasticomyces elasticus]|nr:hypothetical protein LTR56_013557 [Elasticomyces elasticus]KAK3651021.1 hypothetical protein LTR22_012269 [Elasticomyces elasticus]KAK4931099.1 hypothetical protein LTR49_002515 [Elasticomyces elasticus]KAK5765567.1 hypothetical protein LTS12_004319 [Elasticomyces elasticus]